MHLATYMYMYLVGKVPTVAIKGHAMSWHWSIDGYERLCGGWLGNLCKTGLEPFN